MADAPMSLYSTRAHVFQINPETKNSWLSKGDMAIPISFVATGSASRRLLTIVGTNENGETVLDCVILPKTVFNKRSQKFCQWHDNNGMIYGLGFNSEHELNEFMDTFQQLQQDLNSSTVEPSTGPQPSAISQQSQFHQNTAPNQSIDRVNSANATGWSPKPQQQQTLADNCTSDVNGREQTTPASAKSEGEVGLSANQYPNTMVQAGPPQHPAMRRQQVFQDNLENDSNNNNSNNGFNNGTRYPRSQSMFGMQQQQKPSGRGSPNSEILSASETQIRDQLKYENERLKQALEESSKNAGVWQSELINLRTNNGKLTQALQESKAHVEEWEKELLGLRDENKELKLRVMALESNADSSRSEEQKLNMQEYKNYIDQLQSELRKKDNELDQVQRSFEQLELKASSKEAQNGRADDAASTEGVISSYQKQKLDSITGKLNAKIKELEDIRDEYAQLSDKLYH